MDKKIARMLFARKIDYKTDSDIIEMIEETVKNDDRIYL